jgi:hypothetical protein
MDVAELFHEFGFKADIEVVVALLPEMLRIPDETACHSLLQRLQRVCEELLLGLTDQKVDMIRHHYIPINSYAIGASHPFQTLLEDAPIHLFSKECVVVIAREGDEVASPGVLESLKSRWHGSSLLSTPLKPTAGLNGPPRLLLLHQLAQ